MDITVIAPPTAIGPQDNGRAMTAREFDEIEEFDRSYRYELVAGVVIVSPATSMGERKPSDLLGHLLQEYERNHPDGHHLDETLPEHDIVIGENRRRADRVVWCGLGRFPSRNDLPQIAIEFVSKSRRDWQRDYVEKRDEYRSAGIAEYWIIDRFDRTMTVCFSAGSEERFAESHRYTTPLLPGFELPLDRVFEVADRYAD